jgi:glycosyltransferase involved in cell wall biosynthesis
MHTLIVTPAFNEQGKIGQVINKILVQLHSDVLVVDDCLSDKTAGEAFRGGSHVIRRERNQ